MSDNFIPLGKPNLEQSDIDAVVDVLKSGMLVQGTKVAELEAQFCAYTGARHAIAVSNGTASLHLSLLALGVGAGDEVIIPALSYIATANVVELIGATPVFVDVEAESFNIDVSLIEAAITKKTKAIMPVHEFGLACNIEAVMSIAQRYNLVVVEDAACALGSFRNKKHVGTFGNCGSFSLHPRKSVTSGEGGVILTDDDEIADQLRVMRNHGLSTKEAMNFVSVGFNYRLTDIQAALVIGQLKRLENTLTKKRKLANWYEELINGKNVVCPKPDGDAHTWQTYHLQLANSICRDEVIKRFRAEGVGVNMGAQCLPAQTYYLEKYGYESEQCFPHAYRAWTHGLAIPLLEIMTQEDVQKISNLINQI